MAILGAFGVYLAQQSQLKANLKRLDFWGFLMLLNTLAIIGVIVAFWTYINLIDALWTLVFLTPVTLFIFN